MLMMTSSKNSQTWAEGRQKKYHVVLFLYYIYTVNKVETK